MNLQNRDAPGPLRAEVIAEVVKGSLLAVNSTLHTDSSTVCSMLKHETPDLQTAKCSDAVADAASVIVTWLRLIPLTYHRGKLYLSSV